MLMVMDKYYLSLFALTNNASPAIVLSSTGNEDMVSELAKALFVWQGITHRN